MPVIGLRDRVPRPVRFLGVDEDDTGFGEFLVCIAPNIEVAQRRAGLCSTRTLKPGMLIRRMVDYQLGDNAQIAAMCLAHECLEIGHPPIGRVDVLVIGNVVAVVAQWRGIERQQPQRGDPEIVQIIELAAQPVEIANAVVISIKERFYVQLIDNRVPVPQRVHGCWLHEHAAPGERRWSIIGRRHTGSARSRRKIIAGFVSGSRWRRCRVPRQVTTRRVNASSSENSASAAKPNSASGSSISLSCATWGSRLTATITVLALSAEVFAYARIFGSGQSRKRRLRNSCNAGLSRRNRLRILISSLMLPGRSQSHTLYSYFSELR